MAFDPDPITSIRTYPDGADLLVTWTTTADDGTYYQVYVNHRLAWHGTATRCQVAMPTDEATIHVGTVAGDEVQTDFASSLDPIGGTGNRVTLNWTGGAYLDASGNDDVAGFHIYMGAEPGGAVDYTKPVGTIAAYPAGVILDGWGLGRWGKGGWGRADSRYSWTSGPLTSGTWNFAVEAFNAAGIESTALTISQAVTTPPNAPAANGAGKRLTYSYEPATRIATLNWNAST
jgi:hypothetical protein